MTELEKIYLDPHYLDALQVRARRERAQYVHCLVRKFFALFSRRRAVYGLRTAPCA